MSRGQLMVAVAALLAAAFGIASGEEDYSALGAEYRIQALAWSLERLLR